MTQLLLLPHCLLKEQEKELVKFSKNTGFKVYTVGGGTEAIAKVDEHKPDVLVAIACFREIRAGVKELKDRNIKIYTFETEIIKPCHKTKVDVEKVKKLLKEHV